MGPSRIGRWKTAAQTNSRIRHGVSSSAHAMHATLKHFCVDRFLFPRRTWKLVPSARYFTCASRYCAFTQRELKALPPLPFPLPFCCSQGERMRNGGGWAWQCVCIDSMRPRNEAQGFLVQAPLVFLPISLKKKGETEREREIRIQHCFRSIKIWMMENAGVLFHRGYESFIRSFDRGLTRGFGE